MGVRVWKKVMQLFDYYVMTPFLQKKSYAPA